MVDCYIMHGKVAQEVDNMQKWLLALLMCFEGSRSLQAVVLYMVVVHTSSSVVYGSSTHQ